MLLEFRPLDAAAAVFRQCRTAEFWRFFEGRGIKRETVDAFGVGYFPEWGVLETPTWSRNGFQQIGLLDPESGKTRRTYQGRIAIPLPTLPNDAATAGFIFRQLAPDSPDSPKYITLASVPKIKYPPFTVRRPDLYGLPGTSRAITIVEGPLDVHRCYQAGLPQPRGLLGLSTSEAIAAFLSKFDGEVFLMLDWDLAGRRRAFLNALHYLQTGPYKAKLTIVDGPAGEGDDPCDLSDSRMLDVFKTCQKTPAEFVRKWVDLGIDPNDPWQVAVRDRLLATFRA